MTKTSARTAANIAASGIARRPIPSAAAPTMGASAIPRYIAVEYHDSVTPASAGLATTRRSWMRSEEHTSELQSLMRISYAVFCLKKKKKKTRYTGSHNHTEKKCDE